MSLATRVLEHPSSLPLLHKTTAPSRAPPQRERERERERDRDRDRDRERDREREREQPEFSPGGNGAMRSPPICLHISHSEKRLHLWQADMVYMRRRGEMDTGSHLMKALTSSPADSRYSFKITRRRKKERKKERKKKSSTKLGFAEVFSVFLWAFFFL